MKKLLLFALAVGMGLSTIAQVQRVAVSTKAPATETIVDVPQNSGSTIAHETPTRKTEMLNGRAVTYVPIGISGNAYGMYGNPRTYVFADPRINSVVFTHRMEGGTDVDGNSRVAYDVSTDGGETWVNNVKAYSPLGPGSPYPEAGGRYPQGAIISEEGNTDPAAAYYVYNVAALDQTNGGSWGGWGLGVNPLTATDPTEVQQMNLTSEDGIYRLIPDGFTTTQQGKSWHMDANLPDDGGTFVYNGEIVLGQGVIEDGDFVYEETTVDALGDADGINDTKIAFAADGMTGYILIMSDSPSDPIDYTSYHPILLKTEDGGDTWSDPIHIQLGGADGIENIKTYWPDTTIENLDAYEVGFDRDEVYYNMGFAADLIVDNQGNPHVTGIIALGSADGWYPYENTMATWHVFSKDGGMTFDANALYNNRFLEGAVGDIVQYNRPYAASTLDGHWLFFSWLDTDKASATDLNDPNIYVIGYDAEDGTYTEVENVTAFGVWWFNAYYGSMSQYVFENEAGGTMTFEIPFVFEELTGGDADPCNFWYIDGYELSMPVGVGDNVYEDANFAVSQNMPNPAVGNTEVLVTTEVQGVINLSLSNMLGQKVYETSVDNNAKVHSFKFNVSDYETGVYFYTITIGDRSITKKMIVK